jgi:hypothetical protein
MLSFVRAAISANGGTPQSYRLIDAWRELVTVYGGTPTQWTVTGLMREAIEAVGGTPTKWTEKALLRELLEALGETVTSHNMRTLYEQLGSAVAGPVEDTTPPTITSGNPSGTFEEGVDLGGTLAANEDVTWSVTGTDAAAVTLDPDTGVWTLEETVYATQDSYSFSFVATDAALNDSDPQVVAITITEATGALSAPTYTNTAAAGDPPVGEITFNADHEPGHYLRIIRSADGVTEPDGTYTTTTMTVDYQLQAADFLDGVSAAELAAEGYLDPTGAWYQKAGIFAEGGTVENWSAEISGTVTSSTATWATADGVNKHSGLSLEDSNLTLVAEGNGGSTAARASIPAQADDTYFEITVKAFDSDTTGGVRFGVVNSTRALTSTGNIGGSGLADQGVTFRLEPDTANLQVWANGALQSSTALGANPTAGAKAGIRIRKSINTIDVYYAASGGAMSGSPIRTIVMSSPPDDYYAMGCCERGEATLTDCDKLTANFGGSAFHGTNPAGANYG